MKILAAKVSIIVTDDKRLKRLKLGKRTAQLNTSALAPVA